MTEDTPHKTVLIRAEVNHNSDGTETVEHSEVVNIAENTELTALISEWRSKSTLHREDETDHISQTERQMYYRLAKELEGVIESSVGIPPDDVASRLRAAMYEVNDCWEYTESESAKAHIDDAIHHLKAARTKVGD
jgi:hypothetical protein